MRVSDWSSDVGSSDLLIDKAIDDGILAPVVVAVPGASRSLYMDYRDGTERWETFIIADLLPTLRKELNVSLERERTFVAGWSQIGRASCRARACQHV